VKKVVNCKIFSQTTISKSRQQNNKSFIVVYSDIKVIFFCKNSRKTLTTIFDVISLGLSSPPLAPHNNQYNREDNCIEEANESAALPIFIFMVAQVCTYYSIIGLALYKLMNYIDRHDRNYSYSLDAAVLHSSH
jgi:hypothetical protein